MYVPGLVSCSGKVVLSHVKKPVTWPRPGYWCSYWLKVSASKIWIKHIYIIWLYHPSDFVINITFVCIYNSTWNTISWPCFKHSHVNGLTACDTMCDIMRSTNWALILLSISQLTNRLLLWFCGHLVATSARPANNPSWVHRGNKQTKHSRVSCDVLFPDYSLVSCPEP